MFTNSNFKIAIISVIAILFADIANAQTEPADKKNRIGVHFAFGGGGYYAPDLFSSLDYNTKYYYSIGLDYLRVLKPNRWDFCTGIEYTDNQMMVTPDYKDLYWIGQNSYKSHLTLVTIPAQIKYHLWKIFYLNGGVFFNLLSKECAEEYNYSDNIAMLLGCGLGIGVEYEIPGSGLILSLNPYFRWNGIGRLGSFQSDQVKGYDFLQGGANAGIAYKF